MFIHTKQVPADRKTPLFFYLLTLTGFFFLLEISFFIQCNRGYLSDFTFVTDAIHIPLTILPGVLYFIFAQLLVHFAYCVLIWVVAWLVADFLRLPSDKTIYLGMALWSLSMITILVANQYLFPNSKFSELTSILLPQAFTKIVLIFLLLGCFIFSALALIRVMIVIHAQAGIYLLTILIPLILAIIYFQSTSITTKPFSSTEKPNIIIVGIDSLRPDFLGYFGHEKATPFLDSFLDRSFVFTEAVTPLARTFPSWVGILTGQYPKQTGIRSNLAKQNNLDLADTLPAILHRDGYETIYATDETRFSNIDKNFGFDRVVTPPMGLNDFLLGTFNDFPLSNLLVNTLLGKWLFPYSYANRPVYFTYEPTSFLKLLRPALETSSKKPLFLAVHFCLTHHPYIWASLRAADLNVLERYQASVLRVDQQLQDFFTLLNQYQLLDHAIVVVLSDHGEALELPGDRITEQDLFLPGGKIPSFYPPSLDQEAVNQSAGHGTDVLGLPQYHTLLAFRLFGLPSQPQGMATGVVSLLDIKPTILDLIHLSENHAKSLLPVIQDKQQINPEDIFLESDFTPEAIRTVYPETRQVVLEGIQLFQIDPHTTRLIVKDKMTQMIIHSKQYADVYGDWMLAFYPQNKNFRMPILINLVNGQWTNDLQSDFAKQSPVLHMRDALKQFYGGEL